MKKKKVLFLITKSVWGGAQRYVYELARGLPQDRFEAVVAAGGNGLLFERLAHAHIRTISIPGMERDIRAVNELIAFRALLRLLLQERPDVVHLNSTKMGIVGALAAFVYKITARRFGMRTIFTVHGWGFGETRPWIVRGAIFFASAFAALFQNRLITICRSDFNAARRFVARKKIVFIPHGVKAPRLLAKRDAHILIGRRIGYAIPETALIVGTIAELTRNKHHIALIKAAELLARQGTTPLFIIIGEGENRAMLEHEIAQRGLARSFFLAGFIPDAERLLAAFDVFVLPSLKEGLPLSLMDAMAAGIPCVASSIGGIPDLIEHKKNGLLIRPRDSAAIASACLTLLDNPEKRQEFGIRAVADLCEKFSPASMHKATLHLYESI